MTDPNVLLDAVRSYYAEADASDIDPRRTLRALVAELQRLDSHLSAGGTPPEAWREGPDAPELDDGRREREERDRRTLGFITSHAVKTPTTTAHLPADPLGGPIPGVNGSHLHLCDDECGDPAHPRDGRLVPEGTL